jgi:hypothetical protein
LFADFVKVDRILSEQRRLEAEEEAAESSLLLIQSDLVRVQRDLNERLARLARLRRQKRLLVDKGKEMVRRNLESLDELEEVERRELEAVVPASGAFDGIVWGAVDFSSLGPEPADPDSLGGTVVRDIDNVSNS